jgi:metallo-beta-lactamase family protein
MKITFSGAAGTVTGSQHLVDVNGQRILLDCGLFQGKRKEAFETNRRGPCAFDSIDVLVLSHAHIDHSGNIPCLTKHGFTGDIYSTSATRDLCAIMLMDSANIQERDVEFVNKQRKKEGKELFEPLYTAEDAAKSMGHFIGIGYRRRRTIAKGVDLTFVDAGHLFGSAHVVLDIQDEETGKDVRLVFSGDIGRPGIPIIKDPEPVKEGADLLIMESTYGGREHPPYPQMQAELKRVVNETHQRGGTLLIPAFAVGRTQQIVFELHKLSDAGEIPNLPIYVDSPMATRVTEVFRLHPDIYDAEIREFLLQDDHRDPFGFGRLRFTPTREQSMELNEIREPVVIVSSSGMLEGGRILHHLRRRIYDSKNTILITGWQAPDTLGRKVVEGAKKVNIYGRSYDLRAKVEVLTGLSGHADGPGLVEWADAMKKKPSKTFVVHGEGEAADIVAGDLRKRGFPEVHTPHKGDSFDF